MERQPIRMESFAPVSKAGAVGERLIAGWLCARGFSVTRAPDSDSDRMVEGKRVEVKFSTLWANGYYKFQQLRDQNYDLAICLGVSPFAAHCWVIPKRDGMRLWKVERKVASQHGGIDEQTQHGLAFASLNHPSG